MNENSRFNLNSLPEEDREFFVNMTEGFQALFLTYNALMNAGFEKNDALSIVKFLINEAGERRRK